MDLRDAVLLISALPDDKRDVLARILRRGFTVTDRGCWEFRGARSRRQNGFDYGVIHQRGRSNAPVHAVMYEIFVAPISRGMVARHTCDNPPCGNPAHIIPGTQRQNMIDKVSRGRANMPVGENHQNAKLTNAQVVEIRHRYAAGGISQPKLVAEYGVSKGTIQTVVARTRWRTVP